MFLEMAHCFPEHCSPRAGGSQRDALGSLLCLRGWPLSTPSVWKDFGKQIQTQTLAGKACCVTSTCSKHHSPLKCLSNPRAALPGPAHHTKNSWMREMLKSFLWLSATFSAGQPLLWRSIFQARPSPAPNIQCNKATVYA